jgi:hypothetical protein
LAGFFILAQAFAAAEDKESKPAKKSSTPKSGKVQVQEGSTYRKWLRKDLAFLADSNTAGAIRAKLKQFEGLEKGLEKINQKSKDEVGEWTLGIGKKIRLDEDTLEDRIDLGRDVQRQVIRELVFLRGIAVKEGAKETAAAIEGVLLDRQRRYEKIFDEMSEAEDRIRQRDREERERKRSERKIRDRSRDRDRDNYRDRIDWNKRRVPKRGTREQEGSTAR